MKNTRKEEALALENTSLDLLLILKVPPTSWSRESFIMMKGKVDRTVETVSVFASILLLAEETPQPQHLLERKIFNWGLHTVQRFSLLTSWQEA